MIKFLVCQCNPSLVRSHSTCTRYSKLLLPLPASCSPDSHLRRTTGGKRTCSDPTFSNGNSPSNECTGTAPHARKHDFTRIRDSTRHCKAKQGVPPTPTSLRTRGTNEPTDRFSRAEEKGFLAPSPPANRSKAG